MAAFPVRRRERGKNLDNDKHLSQMNTPTNIIHVITAQSWNDTWFTYNVSKDTWEMNPIVDRQHYATEADMPAATSCAERERALFRAIELEEYDYNTTA